MTTLRTPDARFENLPGFPFEAQYVDIDDLRRSKFGSYPILIANSSDR